MSRINILIGTPCYGGMCTVDFMTSLLNTKSYFEPKGVNIGVGFLSNESLIPRGRNTIVAKFLAATQFSHLIFIDSDITWKPEDIAKLIAHDKELSGGCYPKKKLNLDRMPVLLEQLKNLATREGEKEIDKRVLESKLVDYVMNLGSNVEQQGSLLKVKHLGTGFMMIKRSALEKMKVEYPHLKYDDDHDVLTKIEEKELYAFFDTDISEKHYLSEDYLFCKRWQDLDNDIWADLTIELSHTGPYKYTGHFGMSLLNIDNVKTNPFRKEVEVRFVRDSPESSVKGKEKVDETTPELDIKE